MTTEGWHWHDCDELAVKTLMGLYIIRHKMTLSDALRHIAKDIGRSEPSVRNRWHNKIKIQLDSDSGLLKAIKENSPQHRGKGIQKGYGGEEVSEECIGCNTKLTDENCTQGDMFCDVCENEIHNEVDSGL